jgi:hypothetical protein
LILRILRDQPAGWIGALEQFDDWYVPESGKRADAEDDWRRVADALAVLAGSLDLRAGRVPADPILAWAYVCWCFFNGDTAQHTGDLDAADRWFAQVAEASGDDEDGAAMRAFASYQRADVWIPSDTGRSLQADSAIKKS